MTSESSIDLLNRIQLFVNATTKQHIHQLVLEPNNGPPHHKEEGNDHRGLNVNNGTGNIEWLSDKTQRFLAPARQEQWINTNNSNVFDNPAQVVHTILYWLKAKATEEEIQVITQIRWLNQTAKLTRAIQTFCTTKEITLTRGTKSFEELLSCNEPEHNLILIVAVATKHQYK